MILKILGSGSSGNCYLLQSKTEVLIIECGIRFSEVKKTLEFDLSNVVGCISSHSHGDHFKYAKDVIKSGIDVYASKGTIEESKLPDSHRLHTIKDQKQFTIGSFKILPFEVKHDTIEPLNFFIQHPEMGNLLFLTDTWYCPFKFQNLNQLMVEANYCENILNERLSCGNIHPSVANRVRSSHMEIQTLKAMLSANDLTKVNQIVLLHLSRENSDSARFQKEIFELTGKETTVAEKNMTLNFNKTPF